MPGLANLAPIRVLIAESQAVIRSGVRLAFEESPDIRVCGEAADLPAALRAIRRDKPDIAVVELALPGAEPAEVVRGLAAELRDSLVLLSASDDPDEMAAAVTHGARVIVSKRSPMSALLEAIRSLRRTGVSRTEASLEPAPIDDSEAPEPAWSSLTARERDVADLVAQGLAYRDVAVRLGISDHTVKNHLRNIYDKLDIHSRVALAVHGAAQRR